MGRPVLVAAVCGAIFVAFVSCYSNPKIPKPMREYGSIFEAAAEGDWGGVRDCMRRNGEEPTQRDRDGRTVLHYAAAGGSEEVIRNLVAFGADVNARDRAGTTPLKVAEQFEQERAVEVLRELGAAE